MIHIVFNEADIAVLQQAIEMDESLQGDVWQVKDEYAVGPLKDIYTEAGMDARKQWWKEVLAGGDYDGKTDTGEVNDAQLVKDELPLLQHILMRIWDREKHAGMNGELDLDDYESIGGIEKALSNHADEALTGMSPAELNVTKKMFQA